MRSGRLAPRVCDELPESGRGIHSESYPLGERSARSAVHNGEPAAGERLLSGTRSAVLSEARTFRREAEAGYSTLPATL